MIKHHRSIPSLDEVDRGARLLQLRKTTMMTKNSYFNIPADETSVADEISIYIDIVFTLTAHEFDCQMI